MMFDIELLQELYNHYHPDTQLIVDGVYGPKTEAALYGWYNSLYRSKLNAPRKKLSKQLGVEAAALQAVMKVESSRGAFLAPHKPYILFEAHKFSKHTKHKYDESYPKLSSPYWDRTLYGTYDYEWSRLMEASKLDHEAALKSASWGKYQILGENYQACGFDDVFAFVAAMKESEQKQDEAFVNFIRAHPKMHQALQNKDWATFARLYNGPGYKANKYDERLQAEYERAQ